MRPSRDLERVLRFMGSVRLGATTGIHDFRETPANLHRKWQFELPWKQWKFQPSLHEAHDLNPKAESSRVRFKASRSQR